MHNDKLTSQIQARGLAKETKYRQNNYKHIVGYSVALAILICIICYQQWLANRVNKRNKKKLTPPIQVWEQEGGNIPSVPTPSPVSPETEKKLEKERKN